MLDIKFIRENKEKVEAAIKNKKQKVSLDFLCKIDDQRRELLGKIDEARSERNKLAELAKNQGKPTDEQIESGKKIKEGIAELEKKLTSIEEEYLKILYLVPNITADDVPLGPDESGNIVLRKVGEPPVFDFKAKDHLELGTELGIIDTEKASRISGARFDYLFGGAALIQFALINFVLETLTNSEIIAALAKKTNNPSAKPFVPVIVPDMVKSEIMKKMDRFEPLEDRYYIKEDDVLLIGSAEHSLGPLHMDEIIPEEDLPIRYVGYSTAFRREAGSYGKDTTGILRRHQFDKLEMESFTKSENGRIEQDFIVAVQEYLIAQLKIPYQVVSICTGDMGKPDYRQIDIECYLPGQGRYRETHTSDYMTDYQARRLNIKSKNAGGEKEFVHMNDATAFAIGRILIAILENYQQADGSVKIPEALQKYIPGGLKVIKK
ncbi:MAG TPA: serine--tRNA ligase [Candidatus Methylomirabilis sp.]|nr:serine--tRNA ligase [Candidatus Methylomirabilis sp.]